jgi:hypothetical protein
MMNVLAKIAKLVAAFTAGVVITWTVLHEDGTSHDDLPEFAPSSEKQTANVRSRGSVDELPQTQQGGTVEDSVVVYAANLPNTPPAYVKLLPPSWREVSLEDLHWTFAREPRHEAWAFDVETQLAQHVEDKEVANQLVVEHIECREMTCEVAGYLLGDEGPHIQELFSDFDKSVWWHEQFSMHSMRGDAGGMRRFLLIITAQSFDNRVRPPRPLN